jgi:hypothetical protein
VSVAVLLVSSLRSGVAHEGTSPESVNVGTPATRTLDSSQETSPSETGVATEDGPDPTQTPLEPNGVEEVDEDVPLGADSDVGGAGADGTEVTVREYTARPVSTARRELDADLAGTLARLEAAIGAAKSPADAASARFEFAEALIIEGSKDGVDRALQVWGEIARSEVDAEIRGRALYLLGEHSFVQSFRVSRSAATERERALRYFQAILDGPESTNWSEPARRAVAFLQLAKPGTAAPQFEADFGDASGSAVRRSSDLAGKVTLLIFWSSSSPGHGKLESTLVDGLARTYQQYPQLAGKVEVLGINLDLDPALFREAVDQWRIQWPQHHDAAGFEGRLARLFAVPKTPCFAVIDSDWRIRYLGDSGDLFLAHGSRALRDLRLALDAALEASRGEAPAKETSPGTGTGSEKAATGADEEDG